MDEFEVRTTQPDISKGEEQSSPVQETQTCAYNSAKQIMELVVADKNQSEVILSTLVLFPREASSGCRFQTSRGDVDHGGLGLSPRTE